MTHNLFRYLNTDTLTTVGVLLCAVALLLLWRECYLLRTGRERVTPTLAELLRRRPRSPYRHRTRE